MNVPKDNILKIIDDIIKLNKSVEDALIDNDELLGYKDYYKLEELLKWFKSSMEAQNDVDFKDRILKKDIQDAILVLGDVDGQTTFDNMKLDEIIKLLKKSLMFFD